jgi:hypothetical protein
MVRVFIPASNSTTGAGCTGLTSGSTNLAIAYSRELQNGGTQITGANLVTITTIGTWASPGTGKLGFKAVDATNFPGVYEIHFPDDAAAFGTGDTSKFVMINVLELTTSALNIGPNIVMIPLSANNVLDGEADVVKLLGTAWLTPGTAGTPDVNVKLWNGLTTVALPLTPTTAGRTLDVSAGGEAGIDWANIGSPTTTVNLSGTTVKTATDVETDTADIQTRLPAALGANGNLKADVRDFGGAAGTFASGIPNVNVATFSASAITSGAFASGAIHATAIDTGALRNDAFADGAITAAKLASDCITAAKVAADVSAEVADAVWDEVLSGHLTAGTTGNALNAAGAAGDPWSTALPGAYGAGTAGKILGDNLNATISSRASQTSLDTLDDYVDTEISAIKAKTDNLPASPAATGDIPSADDNAAALLDLTDGVETGITVRGSLRALLATAAGTATGGGGTSIVFKNPAGSTTRVTLAVDTDGNRTSTTLNV